MALEEVTPWLLQARLPAHRLLLRLPCLLSGGAFPGLLKKLRSPSGRTRTAVIWLCSWHPSAWSRFPSAPQASPINLCAPLTPPGRPSTRSWGAAPIWEVQATQRELTCLGWNLRSVEQKPRSRDPGLWGWKLMGWCWGFWKGTSGWFRMVERHPEWPAFWEASQSLSPSPLLSLPPWQLCGSRHGVMWSPGFRRTIWSPVDR